MLCWRVENSSTSLGSVTLEFQVDLLFCASEEHSKRFLSERRCSADVNPENVSFCYLHNQQIVGSQHIILSDIGAETVMKGHSLLFQKKGICEIRGLSVCSLIDFRFDHHLDTTINIKPFTSYLFEGLTVVIVD